MRPYAFQSHGVPPAGRHEGALLSDGNRLLSITQNKPPTQVYRYCHLWIVCVTFSQVTNTKYTVLGLNWEASQLVK